MQDLYDSESYGQRQNKQNTNYQQIDEEEPTYQVYMHDNIYQRIQKVLYVYKRGTGILKDKIAEKKRIENELSKKVDALYDSLMDHYEKLTPADRAEKMNRKLSKFATGDKKIYVQLHDQLIKIKADDGSDETKRRYDEYIKNRLYICCEILGCSVSQLLLYLMFDVIPKEKWDDKELYDSYLIQHNVLTRQIKLVIDDMDRYIQSSTKQLETEEKKGEKEAKIETDKDINLQDTYYKREMIEDNISFPVDILVTKSL